MKRKLELSILYLLLSITFALAVCAMFYPQNNRFGSENDRLSNATVEGNLDVTGSATTTGDQTIVGVLKGSSPLKVRESIELVDDNDVSKYQFYVQGIGIDNANLPATATDNTLIFQTDNITNAYNMELMFWDEDNTRPVLTLNEGAVARASTFERSLMIGIGSVNIDSGYTDCSIQGVQYIDCDTPSTGGDLFVKDDIEAGGNIYAQGDIVASNLGTWDTFTPTVTLVGGSGNTVPVYTTNNGRYTTVGNIVYVDVLLKDDGGAEGAGTGQINIALPVTAGSSVSNTISYPVGSSDNGFDEHILLAEIDASATTIGLRYSQAIDNITNFTGSLQNNSTRAIKLHF